MAKRSGQKRSIPGLGLFFICAVAVLLTAASAIIAIELFGRRARSSIGQELGGSHSVHTAFQQHRYRQLELISRIFSTDELLTGYLTEAAEARDNASVFDIAEEYQNLLTFDLGIVLDSNGLVLARTDDPDASGEDLSSSPFLQQALEDNQAFGVWNEGDALYHAATVPLVRDFDRVGYVMVAFRVDDGLARQVRSTSGAETIFLANSPTGPAVAASTFDPTGAEELISALRVQGDMLSRVTGRGEIVPEEELQLQGKPWMVLLQPLRDASNQSVGAMVALVSLEEQLVEFRLSQLITAAAALLALALALALAITMAQRTAKPLRQLATATEQLSSGDYEAALPAVAHDHHLGRISSALTALKNDLAERRALEAYVGRLSRHLPEPARDESASRPQTLKATLVAVEMRRFANPKTGYDAEESLGRFGRDLRRIAASVSTRKGHIEAVYGHRVLASFPGDSGPLQALAAATEVMLVLSQRENVFDEPDPPVVALTVGNVVSGSILWKDQPTPAIAGLPVQLLESLMREATPGELFLAKPIVQELAATFQQAAVKVRSQRGLLSTQPLYVLSTEMASKVTGIDRAPEAALQQSTFPGDSRTLSDVVAGTVLGDRFDILAELGAGRLGVVFKAQDRHAGDLVALKMLKPEVVADAVQFDRLRRTLRQARTLQHPFIVSVLDFGEVDGLPYISMEYVRGMSLRWMMGESRQVPIVAAFRLARQICSGLGAAHQEKLLHLGLKPENILVETIGRARLMDFGLAPPVRLGSGLIPGAQYLAPEQLEGRESDARTDIYTCGIIFYELLTGKVPYPGGSLEEVQLKQLQEDAVPPSTHRNDIPESLDQIVLQAIAKAPSERFTTAADFLAALDALRTA